MAGWFTTFFKDAVDPDDNFDSRPGANLFIKHIKYEAVPGVTVAATVQETTTEAVHNDNINKQTDTESIPFNNILTRKEPSNEFVDRKQVDAEEEVLKQIYEGGDGGAADSEEVTANARAESTQTTEAPKQQHDCFSKTPSYKTMRVE